MANLPIELNASIGQCHTAPWQMQQLAADEIFVLADMTADGTLANEKCSRGLTDGTLSYGGVESFDGVQRW